MLNTKKIKQLATETGFSACGITPAIELNDEIQHKYLHWVKEGNHGEMLYLEKNMEKRINPKLLVPEAKTIIVVLLNYYPPQKQPSHVPQVAKCAYGRDYHKIVKKKLKVLYNKIRELYPAAEGRFFCDSAPVMERIWALRAGLGWIGKNNLLINKKLGSYFG